MFFGEREGFQCSQLSGAPSILDRSLVPPGSAGVSVSRFTGSIRILPPGTHFRPPSLLLLIQIRQLFLEWFIKQDMPVLTQEHKQFGLPYPLHNLFLLYRKRYRRVPT